MQDAGNALGCATPLVFLVAPFVGLKAVLAEDVLQSFVDGVQQVGARVPRQGKPGPRQRLDGGLGGFLQRVLESVPVHGRCPTDPQWRCVDGGLDPTAGRAAAERFAAPEHGVMAEVDADGSAEVGGFSEARRREAAAGAEKSGLL